jgi:hypothetical protein
MTRAALQSSAARSLGAVSPRERHSASGRTRRSASCLIRLNSLREDELARASSKHSEGVLTADRPEEVERGRVAPPKRLGRAQPTRRKSRRRRRG